MKVAAIESNPEDKVDDRLSGTSDGRTKVST